MALPSSFKTLSSKCSSSKPSSTLAPTIHISTDLPCDADKDLGEIPHPTYTTEDIVQVQSILLSFVPVELADAIIDLAEYWPWVSVSRNSFTSAYSALEAPDHNAEWCYLVSPKVPSVVREGRPLPTEVKMVKFFIKTYQSSYGKGNQSECTDTAFQGYETWFESMILKNGESPSPYSSDLRPNTWFANMAAPHPKYLNDLHDPDLFTGDPISNPLDEKKRWHVAKNSAESTSLRTVTDNDWDEIAWKRGDRRVIQNSNTVETLEREMDPITGYGNGVGFLDSLSVDDQIVLMARAMSPGWINTIFNVKIDIYYAFSSSYL